MSKTRWLADKAAILAKAQTPKQWAGVYFLINDDEIVYVGQAVDLARRISQHWGGDKVFNKFALVECSIAELSNVEAEYIVKFAPRYNVTLPPNDKWTTRGSIRRRAKELGMTMPKVKKYMRQHGIGNTNGFFLIEDFELLLGEGWR